MIAKIEFIEGIYETTTPTITLTRSRDGSTATAIFTFQNKNFFKKELFLKNQIQYLTLIDENFLLKTKFLKVIFINGKPRYISALFIFKTKINWIRFIHFMNNYAFERSLVFKKL